MQRIDTFGNYNSKYSNRKNVFTMAEIGKYVSSALIFMFAWTVCLGNFQGSDFQKKETSVHLNRSFPLDKDTQWPADKTPGVPTFSARTSPALLLDQLGVALNSASKLTTRESSHKDILSKLIISNIVRERIFSNRKEFAKTHHRFVKDRKISINIEKTDLEILDATKEKWKLSLSAQKAVDVRTKQSGNEQASNINTITPVDNKSDIQTLPVSEIEVLQEINSSRNNNCKSLGTKNNNSNLVEKISQIPKHLIELWEFLTTSIGKQRFRRNTMNETSYTETNFTDVELVNQLVSSAEPDNYTETSNIDNALENVAGDRTDSVPNTDTTNTPDWEETSAKEERYENLDVSSFTDVTNTHVTVPEDKNHIEDIVNKTTTTPDFSQGKVTEPPTNAYSSDTNNTFSDAFENISTVFLNLSESISSATTNFQPNEASIVTALLNEATTTNDYTSSDIATSSSQFQTSMHYSAMSTQSFDLSESHSKTLDSETDIWTVKYDTATSSDFDKVSLDITSSVSTPSDVQISHVELSSSSSQSEYESESPEFSTATSLVSSRNDHLDTFGVTTTFKNYNTDQMIPKFKQEVDSSPTNITNTDVYPNTDKIAVTRSGYGLTTFTFNEAGPDWQMAKEIWRYAWEIHIYAFGSLFLLVGLYTALSFVRLWWIHCLFSSGYFISLHVLLMFLCFTRSFYLLYDGYGSSGTFHASVNHFLYSVSFPCLTSTFSVLFFSLLSVTGMWLVAPSLQKLQVLVVLLAVHFGISITADVLWGFYPEVPVMQFLCYVYFASWGLFLFLGYICIFRKLLSHAVKRQKDVLYTSSGMSFLDKGNTNNGETLSIAVKVMFCTALCGLIAVGLEVYGIIGVYKSFTRGRPEPWTWWLYHTVLRIVEFVMCLTLSYVASLPLRYRKSEKRYSCGVFCAPCSEIFCCVKNIKKHNSVAGFNHFEQISNYNHDYNENGNSLTENSSKKLLTSQLNFTIPSIDIQPSFSSRPNSLLIIEDGYVRFQTDYDINKIVDSCSDLSQRSADAHSMSTFLRTDGLVSTGYSLNPREVKDKASNNNVEANVADTSRKGSMTSSDFFRVPSSISLADSMENELVKAFESFKMDTSSKDNKDNESTDRIVTSNFQISKETDLVSVTSLPGMKSKVDSYPQEQSNQTYASTSDKDGICSDGPTHQLYTLPKAARSPEVHRNVKERDFSSDPNLQQKPFRSFFRDDTSHPVSKYSPNVKYLPLLDNDKNNIQTLYPEDGEHKNLELSISTRRPSEGQGNQAAVLTSLLKSWESGSNENIDV